MAQTVIKWGDPRALKKWAPGLAVDINRKSYWNRKFIGTGENNIVEEKLDLVSDAGDRVQFDLSAQLRQKPTSGDNRIKGKEESLRFFSDEVIIDQLRHPVNAGGKMTRKRTQHDLRKVAKERLSDYWKKYMDEIMFIYLSGARGHNSDFIEDTDYIGHAGNALQAPDSAHILYGGSAKAKAELTATDKMAKAVIERANTAAKMVKVRDQDSTEMLPVSVEGADRYVCVMSTYQSHDMRTADTSGWIDIQKAAAGAEGSKNRIFTGGLGMIGNTILHDHPDVIRFTDYGAGANIPAARALLLGKQAGVIAYGTPAGMRWSWEEELEDYGNLPTVASGAIFGLKKTRFNGRDFGVMAIDTAAKDPEAA
ncbi:N4-gp56 family major capsid protein [Cereibacter sphaeroides]|nr:N4-gp56 family major capsid protein [Cereibacter sphaeroides]RDS95575.1 N4-gp56 family major capsid protein [Cereibacter sphaeroides f. sp. denitrificans]